MPGFEIRVRLPLHVPGAKSKMTISLTMVQVEIRNGWPRERTPAQRLPFDEEQWRRKPFKNFIGLAKAQNVKRVLKFTEHTVHGAHTHALAHITLTALRSWYMSAT